MHFFISVYHSSLHSWKRYLSAPSLPPSLWLLRLQNDSTWAWGKEKSYIEQNQLNREVVLVWRCFFWPGTVGYSESCPGEAATICPATTLISSHALSKAYAAGSPSRFADWSFGRVRRIDFWHCLAFFDLSDIGDFHLVSTSYSKIHFITSDDSTK